MMVLNVEKAKVRLVMCFLVKRWLPAGTSDSAVSARVKIFGQVRTCAIARSPNLAKIIIIINSACWTAIVCHVMRYDRSFRRSPDLLCCWFGLFGWKVQKHDEKAN